MELIAQVLKADEPQARSYTDRQGLPQVFNSRRLTLYSGGETISAELTGALATAGTVFVSGPLYKVHLHFVARSWNAQDGTERFSNEAEIKRIAAM